MNSKSFSLVKLVGKRITGEARTERQIDMHMQGTCNRKMVVDMIVSNDAEPEKKARRLHGRSSQ
jgi:hypothetical protein